MLLAVYIECVAVYIVGAARAKWLTRGLPGWAHTCLEKAIDGNPVGIQRRRCRNGVCPSAVESREPVELFRLLRRGFFGHRRTSEPGGLGVRCASPEKRAAGTDSEPAQYRHLSDPAGCLAVAAEDRR